ncbi:MAG TPA: DUF5684 domain-containing protein [Chthonomonadaceae bacterium]|nr:DUF5684 domain-containing protein [Chthonomonadaceae bacterium]
MSNLIVDIIGYIIVALPVYIIAKKSEHEYAWLAFVPIANLWLMCDMADKDYWWLLLFCLPIVNFIVYILVWMAIAENTNKPAWLGLLMAIPVVSLVVAFYMALYEPKQIRY